MESVKCPVPMPDMKAYAIPYEDANECVMKDYNRESKEQTRGTKIA